MFSNLFGDKRRGLGSVASGAFWWQVFDPIEQKSTLPNPTSFPREAGEEPPHLLAAGTHQPQGWGLCGSAPLPGSAGDVGGSL